MAKKYVLSEADQQAIRALVKEYVGSERGIKPRGRTSQEHDHQEFPAPEIYVAKTPTAGIAALSGTTPGWVDCDIYRAVSDGAVPPTYTLSLIGDSSAPTQKRILNISSNAIGGDTWVLVKRDKFGQWYAEQSSGESTFLALLTKKTYLLGGFIAYDWIRVDDEANPTPVTYTETATQGGVTLGNPAYHVRNLDYPVAGVDESGATGTGTQLIIVEPLSIVRMWLGTGSAPGTGTGSDVTSYYLFDDQPWVDLFRRTGVSDAYGEVAYHRYWNQNTQVWEDGREVRLVEAE